MHKLVFNEVDDKIANYNGMDFDIKDEFRGKRDKFWLIKKSDENGYNPKDQLLFKYKRNEVSVEDIGEAIYYNLAKQFKYKTVPYYIADFIKLDGTVNYGVVCPNYKKSLNEEEISGKALTRSYANWYYDNYNGATPDIEYNTISHYMCALASIYKIDREKAREIRTELLKLSFLDYLFLNADRHWFNVCFLTDPSDVKNSIRLVESFDNGNCFFCNRSADKLKLYANQLLNDNKSSELMYNYSLSKIPMLGIITSTVEFEEHSSGANKMVTKRRSEDILHTYVTELAKEIIDNKELKRFCNNCFNKMDIDEAFSKVPFQDKSLKKALKIIARSAISNRKEMLKNECIKLSKKSGNNEFNWN